MKHKIFLGKYRVASAEMALIGPEPAGDLPVTEQPQSAVVYHGEEIDSGRDVNVEVIPATFFKSKVRNELETEAIAAKKINNINIPALYDFGIEDGHLIYVTEYLEGTTTEEWVNDHGPMPPGVVLRIALQVVAAMGAASFHRISHHALNPGNLLLVPGQTPEGEWPLLKVLHFVGVAPTIGSADTSVASFDKSSHYASPEQLRNGVVDFRSEIYSLGATMWFLLTGAPPLVAEKGPLAMQPTTIGLAVDKLNGMPKKVRRLLSQMLSVDPEARPQEPLAFYRQLQDCLAQVGRRESMARRFGMPLLANTSSVVIPGRRRFPAKALALAAMLLLIVGIAGVMVPSYLRHQRVRQAEEPIGVPVGVPEPVASASSKIVQAPPAAQPPEVPSDTSVAKANIPVNPLPTAAQESAPVTAPKEVAAAAPVQPAINAPSNSAPSEAPKEVAVAPPQPAVTTSPPATLKTEEAPVVAANNPSAPAENNIAPPPVESVDAEASKPKQNHEKDVASDVPTARAVTPEVRRAEPAPPGEGPEEEVAKTEQLPEPPAPKAVRAEKRTEDSRTRTERTAKAKREPEKDATRRIRVVDEAQEAEVPIPRYPDGRVRARFIGVTPEGDWMFALPSKKIVVLPPPPGG
ncbi:MAG: protein kinase [Chthoniobacterales bacterium]